MNYSKRFLALFSALALAIASAVPAGAQAYVGPARGLSINPTNSVLLGPLDFFVQNSNQIWRVIGITNLDSLAKATNGFLVAPVLTNGVLAGGSSVPNGATLTIASGGSVSGASGSSATFPRVALTGDANTFGSGDAITKGYVDTTATLVFLVIPPDIVNNLAGLVGVAVSQSVSRFCYVRNSTGNDNAAGLWIWDRSATTAESPVVKKSSNLSPSDPGRWIKL
jgi:hypothetical protein